MFLSARTIVGATPWDTQGPQDTDAMDLMWAHWLAQMTSRGLWGRPRGRIIHTLGTPSPIILFLFRMMECQPAPTATHTLPTLAIAAMLTDLAILHQQLQLTRCKEKCHDSEQFAHRRGRSVVRQLLRKLLAEKTNPLRMCVVNNTKGKWKFMVKDTAAQAK